MEFIVEALKEAKKSIREERRSVGRPRTKPVGLKRREWWASDVEIRRLQKVADARGVSVQDLVRQLAIAACRG